MKIAPRFTSIPGITESSQTVYEAGSGRHSPIDKGTSSSFQCFSASCDESVHTDKQATLLDRARPGVNRNEKPKT
jgi:hypothetical protein